MVPPTPEVARAAARAAAAPCPEPPPFLSGAMSAAAAPTLAPSGAEMERRAVAVTRSIRRKRRAKEAFTRRRGEAPSASAASAPSSEKEKSISSRTYRVARSAPCAKLWRHAAKRSRSAFSHSCSIRSHIVPARGTRVGVVRFVERRPREEKQKNANRTRERRGRLRPQREL